MRLISRWGFRFWLVAATLAVSRPATARDFFVAQGNPLASDRNPGTAQLPWSSISTAAAAARPGDSVTISAGIYREHIRALHSGTAEAPIIYQAAPGQNVVITGADVITDWQRVPGDAPIWTVRWLHQFIAGTDQMGNEVEFYPESAPLWGRAEQVIVDGHQLRPELSLADLRRAWEQHQQSRQAGEKLSPIEQSPLPNLGPTFAGAFAVNTSDASMWIWLADGSNPNSHIVEAATRSEIFGPAMGRSGLRDIQVHGITFRYGASFPQRGAVNLMGENNLLVDCTVEQMAGTGVAVDGTMLRCTIRNCGHTGGCAGNDGFVDRQCLWEGNAWKPIKRQWDSAGVKIGQTDGGTFDRCVFRRNGGFGLWFDVNVRNVTVRQCEFIENEMSGVFVEISHDMTIQDCLAVRNGVDAVGKSDIWGIGGIELGESMNCRIEHDTCVGNDVGISLREQGPRDVRTPEGRRPFHIFQDQITNNVCADNKEYQIGLYYDNPYFGMHPNEANRFASEEEYSEYIQRTAPDTIYDPLKQQLRIDGNLYFSKPGEMLALFGVSWRARHHKFGAFGDYVAATGFDTTGKFADPQFRDPQKLDYRFDPSSPAVAMHAGWLSMPADWKELLAEP